MNFIELLERIRQPYIRQFSGIVAQSGCHVEPVLRDRTGSIVYEGPMRTPYRCDLVRKDTFATESVDATERLRFDTLCFDIGTTRVQLAPFSWDALTLEIDGMARDTAAEVMRNWFLRWFDADDENAADADGLYGVVHFLGDPVDVGAAVRFQVDLGSVPAGAVSRLIEELCTRVAAQVNLG